jgi:K+-sensing histidine kinase KdpD
MNQAPSSRNRGLPEEHRPIVVGPLIAHERIALRYGVAIALVMITAAVRYALVPVMGTQVPFLPFILAVLGAAAISGLGPAIVANGLAPIFATVLFTEWPDGPHPGQWSGHVVLFVSGSVLVAFVIHQLQQSARAQLQASRVARAAEREARQSATHLRLIAGGSCPRGRLGI